MLKALKTKPPQDRWFLLGCLVSLELLMSFSFFGYLHVEPVSITFAYIPVLIGGCLLGPVDSTILGIVFGLASLWKASASYVMDFDRVFSPFLSGSPVRSLLLSVGSRALFGLLIGLLYQLANRSDRHTTQWLALVTLFGKHDEAGADDLAGHVHFVPAFVDAEAHDQTLRHGNVAGVQLP